MEWHQYHYTGPTTDAIPHDNPINQWTTTKGIGLRRKWILGSALAATLTPPPPPPSPPFCGRTSSNSFIGSGDIEWTVPPGVFTVYVEAQGGGIPGDNGAKFGGSGGGGGGYGAGLLAVTPGQIITGHAGVASESSYFSTITGDTGGSPDYWSGGTLNSGDFTSNGGDGSAAGEYHGPGGHGGNSGSGASGGGGGDGAPPADPPGPATNGMAGGNYGGGGGGGGGDEAGLRTGGDAGVGYLRVTWANIYGIEGNTHQVHDTGQTNFSIQHCQPLNTTTTTKGISMRKKWILGALAPNEFLELPCARLTTPVTFIPTEGDINTPWIVPNGVCQILVECQGEGGGFPNGSGDTGSDGVGGSGSQGGHGGGYGSSIINVVPGTIYNINITEGSGAFFQTQFFVNIVAGYSGDDNIGGGLGDLVYDGNVGGGGSLGGPQVEDNNGPGGNGGNGGTSGYNSVGGSGGSGAGYNGDPLATSGTAGANYGGGGGGGGGGSGAGETPGSGGLGGLGFVRISWWGFYGLKSPRICLGGD